MSENDSGAGGAVLSVACPGGMARQFRVQVRDERSRQQVANGGQSFARAGKPSKPSIGSLSCGALRHGSSSAGRCQPRPDKPASHYRIAAAIVPWLVASSSRRARQPAWFGSRAKAATTARRAAAVSPAASCVRASS